MSKNMYQVSVPGSIMLLGEHAVLHNKRAIVMAIDKRMTITLIPRMDSKILINSNLGKLELELDDIEIAFLKKENSIFKFVIATCIYYKKELKNNFNFLKGFELLIESEFSHEVGFGSSAAVVVGTLLVLKNLMGEKNQLLRDVQNIIRSVQGYGSGADAAASLMGGIILYQQEDPFILKHINKFNKNNNFNKTKNREEFLSIKNFPLTCFYSGYKTKTSDVIQKVESHRLKAPKTFDHLFNAIDSNLEEAFTCIQAQNWERLGEIMNIHQGIMNALGVSDTHLDNMINTLKSSDNIWGAKISGSGLGDCVVAINKNMNASDLPENLIEQNIPIQISAQGALSYSDNLILEDNLNLVRIHERVNA